MGDLGTCTRILGREVRPGAPFTAAAFNKEARFAPGMLSFLELQKVYHFERINAETKAFLASSAIRSATA